MAHRCGGCAADLSSERTGNARLRRTAQENKFKLYEADTGLLLSQYAPQTMLDVIADAPSVNFGSVYENAVAQALSNENPDLFYFCSSRKGEVDFIAQRNDGALVPIEVKSGKDYKRIRLSTICWARTTSR